MNVHAEQGLDFGDLVARVGVPLLLTALVHLFAVFAFVQGWETPSTRRELAAPMAITARMVQMQASAPAAETRPQVRAPEPARPMPELQQPAAPTDYVPVLRPDAAAEPRRTEPEPAAEIDERWRDTLAETFDTALAAEAERLAAEDAATAAASYVAAIAARIQRHWSRPPSARNGMQAELQLALVPTGEVVSVTVLRSSGNAAFDRSAEVAVRQAAPFEVPDDPRLFERDFRQLRLLFNPEDLRN